MDDLDTSLHFSGKCGGCPQSLKEGGVGEEGRIGGTMMILDEKGAANFTTSAFPAPKSPEVGRGPRKKKEITK